MNGEDELSKMLIEHARNLRARLVTAELERDAALAALQPFADACQDVTAAHGKRPRVQVIVERNGFDIIGDIPMRHFFRAAEVIKRSIQPPPQASDAAEPASPPQADAPHA